MTYTHAALAQSTTLTARTDFAIDAARRAEFVTAAQTLATFATGKDGARFYRFFEDAEDATRFTLLSEWPDEAARSVHLVAPHTRAFFTALQSLRTAPETIRLYRTGESVAEADVSADPRAIGELPEPAAPTIEKTRERLAAVDMIGRPFVLFVDVPVREGGEAFMKASAHHIAAATRAEPGAIRYGYYQQRDEPGAFLLFEWWDEFDAMARHVELSHFRDLMQSFALVGGDGRSVRVFRPLPY